MTWSTRELYNFSRCGNGERTREIRKERDVGDRVGERIKKLIKYYTILLQCALKNESAL